MKRDRVLLGLWLATLAWGGLLAETRDEMIAALNAGFLEVGRREIARSQAPPDQERLLPTGYEASLPLLKTPPQILSDAIDRGIRGGSVEEKIGALEVYQLAISPTEHRLTKRPEYQSLLLDLLKHDDQKVRTYSFWLVSVLREYRSRETVLAFVDAAPRATNPELRENLVRSAAGLLHMFVPIYVQTTPLEKERVLADLEAWLNRNRDRIRFNKDGKPYLARGEADNKPVELTPEDRSRIRKDPVCVLKLVQAMLETKEEAVELCSRCGEALLGSEGAKLLKESQESAKTQESPSLDSQAAMASARGKYPTMDAVQLAIAYVAAHETDPKSRELARDILEDVGSAEMSRILKGEPREVRKKAKELAGEVSKDVGEE